MIYIAYLIATAAAVACLGVLFLTAWRVATTPNPLNAAAFVLSSAGLFLATATAGALRYVGCW